MAWPTTSRHARGYGSAWDRKRLRILKRDGYLCRCDECKKRRIPLPASEVNHIVPKAKARAMGWTDQQIDADENLQAINSDCHKRVTAQQMGGTLKPKVKIGLDGFPIAQGAKRK